MVDALNQIRSRLNELQGDVMKMEEELAGSRKRSLSLLPQLNVKNTVVVQSFFLFKKKYEN